MADTSIPPIPIELKIFEPNDITIYAKEYDSTFNEYDRVLLFIDETIYWLGKIVKEDENVILSVVDIHNNIYEMHSCFSSGDFEELLSLVLDDDIEFSIPLENITCNTIEEAEQLFNTKMSEE